jgi:hypothetical protein
MEGDNLVMTREKCSKPDGCRFVSSIPSFRLKVISIFHWQADSAQVYIPSL